MPRHTKASVKGKKAFPFAKKAKGAAVKAKKVNPFAKKAKK